MKHKVNNDFYEGLHADWWTAEDHMVVFLRQESKIKFEYLQSQVSAQTDSLAGLRVLDVAAGAGFISIPALVEGAEVTALDLSASSLAELEKRASLAGVASGLTCTQQDLRQADWDLGQFDLILLFDILEHIPQPELLIAKCAKALKPNGKLFFHTLNRSLSCWFLYLWLVPTMIRHCPPDLHRHESNIKPSELLLWLEQSGLVLGDMRGLTTPLAQAGVWELLTTRSVRSPLHFEFTADLSLGYLGWARLV